MKYQVVFHPMAETEYREAYQWYEEQLRGLGERFEEAIEIKLNQLNSKPLLHPRKRGSFREANVDTFPYQIVYKIYEKEKIIFVSSVYHSSRDPKKKYRKLKTRL